MLANFAIRLFACFALYKLLSQRRKIQIERNEPSSSTSEGTAEEDCSPPSSSALSEGAVPKGTYDVFLSFRGEDTRKGFVSHLYRALIQRGIHTFRDDERLDKGKSIAPELLKAIDDSKIAIVVFSKNYANSSWCLDELVHIVESNSKKIVIPVFYDVDPSDIRKQKNAVAEALAKLRTSDDNVLRKWKQALTTAANFSGWDVSKTANGDESECIRLIVEKVDSELSRRITSGGEHLVGIKWRVNKVLELLEVGESGKVVMVGISGMGGLGKTTLAKAVFDEISHKNDASCFLNIPLDERSENGLMDLQKTMLSKILNVEKDKVNISDTGEGANMIRRRLSSKKVLIVLDNVNHRQQLMAFAAEHASFCSGSRVIITTRDNQLLDEVDKSHELELLNDAEANQLLCWHAFGRRQPDEDFVQLCDQIVERAKGLPLALKVMGFHLKGLSLEEWSSEISKLQKIPHNEIQSVLKISYDGLDDINKSIFLDVVCFFRGWNVTKVITMLDSFKFYHTTGISPLVRKSLVSVDEYGRLEMHDLVQEMGQNIARQNHPGSRLWNQEEIVEVLTGKQECEAVEGIVVRFLLQEDWHNLSISNQALKKMKKLRLLVFRNFKRCSHQPPEFLPSELEWLNWDGYPGDSLPASFDGRKLGGLIMQHSRIIELITEQQRFDKLRIMDLSWSHIRRTPDFSNFPSLVELTLKSCHYLVEVHSSLGLHTKLQSLDLSGCKHLEIFPKSLRMKSLKHLNLSDCPTLKKFPEIEGNNMMTALEKLNLSRTEMERTPDFSKLPNLKTLTMSHCRYLVEVHPSFGVHQKLQLVDFSDCSNLRKLPMTLQMESLKRLDLQGCNNLENFPEFEGTNAMIALEELNISSTGIRVLPYSIRNLPSLRRLNLGGCKNMGSQEQRSQLEINNNSQHLRDRMKDLYNANNNSATAASTSCSSIIAIRKIPSFTSYRSPASLSTICLFTLPASFCQLSRLNLASCHLTHLAIPERCLPSLQELDLTDNHLQELVIPREYLSNSLRQLHVGPVLSDYHIISGRPQEEFSRLLHNRGFNLSNMVSLISSASTTVNTTTGLSCGTFDWKTLVGVVHERNSELMVSIPSTPAWSKVPKWFNFKFDVSDQQPSCEVILPRPTGPSTNWCNSKFRGLAVFCAFYMHKPKTGVITVTIKQCCGEETYMCRSDSLESQKQWFQYLPSSSHCFKCCLSDSKTPQQICILDVSIVLTATVSLGRVPSADVEWGIRLVYDDEVAEAQNIDYNDIKVIPVRKMNFSNCGTGLEQFSLSKMVYSAASRKKFDSAALRKKFEMGQKFDQFPESKRADPTVAKFTHCSTSMGMKLIVR